MDAPIKRQPADLRDDLAAERRGLAWMRTGLALMEFGCVVARVGLCLQELQVAQHALSARSYGLSLWFGTARIAGGIIVHIFAGWRHARLVRALGRGETVHARPSTQAVAMAVFLALVGLAVALSLIAIRRSTRSQPAHREEISLTPRRSNGIIDLPSHHSVDDTVEKLKGILHAKGLLLFALVDHSGEADKAGMPMYPTKLLMFGSPKAGTPVMLAAPGSAIDLPLKMLMWEDVQGKVWVTYNSPVYVQERYSLPPELLQQIGGSRNMSDAGCGRVHAIAVSVEEARMRATCERDRSRCM